MTENSRQPGKLFYSIGEVSRMFDVNASLIRFWEKEFDIIRPQKNKKGNRLFTQRDVNYFHLIFNLVKERGYTLQGAKAKIKENKKQETLNDFEILQTLEKMKSFLLEIKKEL